jgi:hypothetical protein
MSTPKVSVILCEGYHDRAFWAGLLEHQGWIDPGKPEDEESERKPVKDPWKRPVTRGKFLFEWHDEGGKAYVIVDPTRGESHMRKRLFDYFEDTDHPVQRILVNLDGDVFARRAGDWRENLERCVEGMVKAAGGVSGARRGADGWTASVHGCPITVVPIACHAGDDPSPGGPVEPNLESLVCTAITTVHPSRGREIADWLLASNLVRIRSPIPTPGPTWRAGTPTAAARTSSATRSGRTVRSGMSCCADSSRSVLFS